MWQYLPPSDAAVTIWLCTEGAWGPKTLEQAIEFCRSSIVVCCMNNSEFTALAAITPIYEKQSCWIAVWLCPRLRRKYGTIVYWDSLKKLVMEKLGFNVVLCITRSLSVSRLANRLGATHACTIYHLYGHNEHGIVMQWHIK